MRAFVFALTVLLGACDGPPSGGNLAAVDINAAADAAQGSIDTYAANALESLPPARPVRAAVRAPVTRPAPVGDTEAALAVVRSYYAALADGRYPDAWALWDDSGAASGTDARGLAARFAGYAEYRATVGVPGAVEAGAGQRFLTVPVTVEATLRDGRKRTLAGSVVLHRTADIDGASQAQRSWHLRSAELASTP